MSTIKKFPTQCLDRKQINIVKTNKVPIEVQLCYKLVLLSCIVFYSMADVEAQKGLFIKFSLGPGYTTEYSNINSPGFTIPTKNHAVGWGITDRFALQIGEFGGLMKQKVEDYNYINLDAFGLGFCYRTPFNIKVSVIGAYSKVSFAHKWSEAFGDDGGNGIGINMSLDKEWFIAKRWAVRAGPQAFWLKTNKSDYKFFNVSLNGSIVFYFKRVK